MSLPKWDKPVHCHCTERCSCEEAVIRYREALAIAWEALESIDKHQAIVSSSMSKYSVTRLLADEALRRIRALGGEE